MWLDSIILDDLKEKAVRKNVEESYQKLLKKLKLLFHAVVLVEVRYCQFHAEDEAAVELLGFMHECCLDMVKT